MKRFLALFLLVLTPSLWASSDNFYVNIHNVGTNTVHVDYWYQYVRDIDGSVNGPFTSTDVAIGAGYTLNAVAFNNGNALHYTVTWGVIPSAGYTPLPNVGGDSSGTYDSYGPNDVNTTKDVNVSDAVIPTYTNFTFEVHNSMSNFAVATWYFNGTRVKQMTLYPGETGSWTTPPIQLTPVAEAWRANATLESPFPTIQYQTNSDGGLTPTIGNQTSGQDYTGTGGAGTGTPTGGGTGGGGSPTPVGATNTQTVLPPITNPLTNNPFQFPAPNGLASESTLAAGFNGLAGQNRDLLSGLGTIDQDLREGNRNTAFATNLLGQIAVYTRSNNDAAWQFSRYLTNLTALTNLNNPLLASTNSLSLTNYALDSTLQTINSNLFAIDYDTNGDSMTLDTNLNDGDITNVLNGFEWTVTGATNYAGALAASLNENIGIVESGLSSYVAGFVDFSGSMQDFYPEVDMTFDMSPYMAFAGKSSGVNVIDFDPLHNEGIAQIIDILRKIFTWAIALLYLTKISNDGFKLVMILNTAHGVNNAAVTAELKKMFT
ncbi:MAG: hypothetical protein WDM80_09445 [Limisphaerales bacterium]